MTLRDPSTKTEDRPLHPAKPTQVIVADIIELGYRVSPNQFQGGVLTAADTIAIVVQSTAIQPGGLAKRFEMDREITYSAGEKSNLRKLVAGALGVSFATDAEATEAIRNLDRWVGRNFIGNIIHKISKATGKPYAFLSSLTPLMDGMKEVPLVGYQRAPFWTKKIEEYKAGYVAWEQEKLQAQVTGAANASKAKSPDAAGSFDDLPAALHGSESDDDPSLPF
jgi:hypothetical protein